VDHHVMLYIGSCVEVQYITIQSRIKIYSFTGAIHKVTESKQDKSSIQQP